MSEALPVSLTPDIRPRDRLGFTLFVAALLHLAILLGISFVTEELPTQSKGLEVTLASMASERAPDKADYIAQVDQQGSGTLDEAATPSTPTQSLLQDSQIKEVSLESSLLPQQLEQPEQQVLTTQTPQTQQVFNPPTPTEQPKPEPNQAPQLDHERLAAEIASLEAEYARERQEYAKRPRVSRQNMASTKRDISAAYRDDWRKKVERIGNLNYPKQARRDGLYGSLRLLVTIRSDGSIHEMLILESSGVPLLDQAAQSIVRLSAPFPPFTGELAASYDQVEVIRTWRFERGDRLSSQ